MDDRKQRIVFSSEESADNAFGWEVADAAALDALAGRLEAAKVAVTRVAPAEAQMRGVSAAIRFQDPAGTRLEAFHGAEAADTRFVPGRPIGGFRTGPLGMGHVVLHVKNVDDLRWFYQDVSGSASATTSCSRSRRSSSTSTRAITVSQSSRRDEAASTTS
jgi:catechol-2,3-dioxygenase